MLIVLEAFLFQGAGESHRKVYEKAAASVCGVRAQATLGERSGTGIILDTEGHILTSYAVVPEEATNIRVWVRGPRLTKGEVVGRSAADEVTLLKIDPQKAGSPAPIEFGDSTGARIGERTYTLGNAANSIINDDQPSFHAGMLSGIYPLTEKRANSSYTGLVLESSAAVNVMMEGAPLLDAHGRMIGMVTLNYSPHRFLGNAIPAEVIAAAVKRLKESGHVSGDGDAGEGKEGTLGVQLKEEGGKVLVTSVVAGGSADLAGLTEGDVILAVAGKKVTTVDGVWTHLGGLKAGAVVWLTVEGVDKDIKIILQEKP